MKQLYSLSCVIIYINVPSLLYELNKDEFGASKGIFGVDDLITKKFKIDISGTEIIFLSDELLIDEKGTTS